MLMLYYLISSLPTLKFGEETPFHVDEFIQICEKWISNTQKKILTRIALTPDSPKTSKYNKTLKEWENWEKTLRNKIVKIRAAQLKKDPGLYLKKEMDFLSEIESGVTNAFASENPKTKETILDELRWQKLDSMEFKHPFDFEKLCIYKLKLLLCGKWISRTETNGTKNMGSIIDNLLNTKIMNF